jgi:glutaredoxin-like protein
MSLLDERVRGQVREVLGELPNPVHLTLFTKRDDCPTCPELAELVREVAALHPALHAEVLELDREPERARALGVEQAPTLAVGGAQDYGIRFLGTPGGFEFATFIQAIHMVSHGASDLPADLQRRLEQVKSPLRIRVFVTPTCPYCPQAVHTANRIAIAAGGVRAEMVEAMEFPELARRNRVRGVPKIVIDGGESFEGAIPERQFVDAVVRAATAQSVN